MIIKLNVLVYTRKSNQTMTPLSDEEYNLRCGMKIIIKSYLPQSDVLTMRLLSNWTFSIVKTYPLKIYAKSSSNLKEINSAIRLSRFSIGKLFYTYSSKVTSDDISNVTHLKACDNVPIDSLGSVVDLSLKISNIAPDLEDLSPTIRHLTLKLPLNWNANQTEGLILPPNLTRLSLENFNQGVDDLGLELTHLVLGSKFNQPIDFLPISLTHLILGKDFDQGVDHLPPNLLRLEFSNYSSSRFNQPVDNLPSKLTHLNLGWAFNQTIDFLPSSLLYLEVGMHFNRPIDLLPPNLSRLKLGHQFDQEVDLLPESLQTLDLGHCYLFNREINNLPSSLLILNLGGNFDQSVDELPNSLACLTLSHVFNREIDNLPPNLIDLTLGPSFNSLIDNLPNGLLYLTLGSYFNRNIDHLPDSLVSLLFGYHFDQSIDNLPLNLNYLQLGNCFNRTIDFLPQNLKRLDMISHYLTKRVDFLPKITHLTIMPGKENLFTIPKSVTHFYRMKKGRQQLIWTRNPSGVRTSS